MGPICFYNSSDVRERTAVVEWWPDARMGKDADGNPLGVTYWKHRESPADVWPPPTKIATWTPLPWARGFAFARSLTFEVQE